MMKWISPDAIALQFGQIEGFCDQPLAGKGGIPMKQERHDLASIGIVPLVLLGSDLTADDWIDGLQMRGIGRQGKVDHVAVELTVRRRTQVILDVPGATNLLRMSRTPLKLMEYRAEGLAHKVGKTLRRPRCAILMTISSRLSCPPRFKICSSAGIIDSPPSRPKRLVPVYFRSRNFSKHSAAVRRQGWRACRNGEIRAIVRPGLDTFLDPKLDPDPGCA